MTSDETYRREYGESVGLLKNLIAGPESGSIGYFASSVDKDNYKRLFTRDAFWIGVAALLTGDDGLIEGFKASLAALAGHQREDGAIPSNISSDGKVSYGIINPRVDPTTLYVLGCVLFHEERCDSGFLRQYSGSVDLAMDYLEKTWENPELELLYIPRAGNWADEYLQQGYVLYDEVLWYLALKGYAGLIAKKDSDRALYYRGKAERVKRLIRERFWIRKIRVEDDDIYGQIRNRFDFNRTGYFLHFFHVTDRSDPFLGHSHGIFDAFGNALALLAGIPTEEQALKIAGFVDEISVNKYPLVPAHYPFFSEDIFRSRKLHQYRFKEYVGHFHNGGLWPWYTGLYAAYFAREGDTGRALKFLEGIMKANRDKKNGMRFYEYHSGKKAEIDLKVGYARGVDFYLSMLMSGLVKRSKSTVRIKYGGKKVETGDDIAVRGLDVKKGDRIRVIAVGPDSGEVLSEMMMLKHGNVKFFEGGKLVVKGSYPGGAPFLGVSAAAFIIAYKAVFDEKCIL